MEFEFTLSGFLAWKGVHDGDGSAGQDLMVLAWQGGVAGACRGEGRHGSQNGTEVSAGRPVAVPIGGTGAGADMEDASGSLRRGLERGRGAARAGAWLGSQDDLRGIATPLSSEARRGTAAHSTA